MAPITQHTYSLFLIALLFTITTDGASAQAPATSEFDSKPAADARLALMNKYAQALKGNLAGQGGAIIPLKQPLLRWTNPYTNIKDGVLVGWTDESGRPVAIAQICLVPDSESVWCIEAQSLAQDSFSLTDDSQSWLPDAAGVQWKSFSEKHQSQPPATTKTARLVQMRRLARRFRGDDQFEETDNVLRLLPSPLVRYEAADHGVVDGAMFALVHGTDPEMIILIELRNGKGKTASKPQYHYALAAMTSFELRGYLDREEVWHKPRMTSNLDTDVFWQRRIGSSGRKGLLQRLFGF